MNALQNNAVFFCANYLFSVRNYKEMQEKDIQTVKLNAIITAEKQRLFAIITAEKQRLFAIITAEKQRLLAINKGYRGLGSS